MTESQKMFAAYIDAAKMARATAWEYRHMASEYPKHALEDLAHAAEARERARDYLQRARLWRVEQ